MRIRADGGDLGLAGRTPPLAASLGLTFSYNVTLGLPIYLEIAKAVVNAWPLTGAGA